MKVKWWQALLFGIAVMILMSCEQKVVFVDRVKTVVRVDTLCKDKLIDTNFKYSFVAINYQNIEGEYFVYCSQIGKVLDISKEYQYKDMDHCLTALLARKYAPLKRKFFYFDSYEKASIKRFKILSTGL